MMLITPKGRRFGVSTQSLANLLLTLVLASSATAEDLVFDAPIVAVRLAPQGALVERRAVLPLPAGEHRLQIDSLPGNTDINRLRVAIDDEAIEVGSMVVRRTFSEAPESEERRRITDDLEALRYEKTLLQGRIKAAETQLTMIEALADGRIASAPEESAELVNLVTALGESSEAASKTIADSRRAIAELTSKIKRLQAQKAQLPEAPNSTQIASVALAAAEARSAEVSVSYPVAAASWRWGYEARLDTENEALTFIRNAVVAQNTGEVWKDVALTVSTASAGGRLDAPPYRGEALTLEAPEVSAHRIGRTESGVAFGALAKASPGAAVAMDVVDSGTAYQAEFRIPGAVTLVGAGEEQFLRIDERVVEARLLSVSRPLQDPTAYLVARIDWEDRLPLQGGSLQVYRDGSYLGTRWQGDARSGSELRLSFGVDPGVAVSVEEDEAYSDGGGTFQRNAVENVRKRFVITNLLGAPKTLDVFAALPVPQSDDIEVTFNDDATPVTQNDAGGRAGQVRWRISLGAGQEAAVRHYYSVRYPKDEQLFRRPQG